MTMRALFDVNILLALLLPDHMHHEKAHRWWDANRVYGWATCPITQNGFVRVASQRTVERPVSISEALEILGDSTSASDHEFWVDDASLLDAALFDPRYILGPSQITDVYLLALAVKNRGRFATLDRSIPLRAVRGADSTHLAVV